MKKQRAKVLRSLVPLKGYGRKIPAVFPLVSHDQLNISKSYYNKLQKRIDNGFQLPSTIKDKLDKIKSTRIGIEFKPSTKLKFTVPKSITEKHAKGDGEFVWIKVAATSNDRLYYDSFVMKKAEIKKKINKRINDFFAFKLKRYSSFSVYVLQISIENVLPKPSKGD